MTPPGCVRPGRRWVGFAAASARSSRCASGRSWTTPRPPGHWGCRSAPCGPGCRGHAASSGSWSPPAGNPWAAADRCWMTAKTRPGRNRREPMNADDPRRKDVAELARLLPAPAERDLPAGRQHTLKEHLMSELRLPASPPAGRPATRRRRTPAIVIAAATAAALAAAVVLTLLPGNTSGASPAAMRLLAKIATAAARQPSPPVRDSQFWYIKSWAAYLVCNGGSGNNCVLEKPHERQIWLSVSNLFVTGLL